MRVLVCGSRTWVDAKAVHLALDGIRRSGHILVIEGGCPTGADAIARQWVERHLPDDVLRTIWHATYPADWEAHGNQAGPIRNQQMLDERNPDLVLAFTDKPLAESKGTADMVRRAEAAGVPVYVIEKRGGDRG